MYTRIYLVFNIPLNQHSSDGLLGGGQLKYAECHLRGGVVIGGGGSTDWWAPYLKPPPPNPLPTQWE